MSNSVIPKEMLTAFQRWEMNSFGGDEKPATPAEAHKTAAKPASPPPPPVAAVPMPSPEELAKIRETARLSGYAAGLGEGREQGYQEGYAAGMEEARQTTALHADALQQMVERFSGELARLDELMAQEILALSLDVAKAMLKNALEIKPELVLPVITEAIGYLPSVQQPATLVLNPEDAVLVQEHMGVTLTQAGWRVREDTQLERGGCCIETPCNEINASASSRWQRITAALGCESGWLES